MSVTVTVTAPRGRLAPARLVITVVGRSDVSCRLARKAYRGQIGEVADDLAERLQHFGVPFWFRDVC